MIINHRHKFVFVHIQKTAGTSITSDLANLGGCEYYYEKHSLINKLSPIYNNYFKFCFVRNPWDRLVSWYNMIERLPMGNNDFIDYIKKNANNFSEFLDATEIIDDTKETHYGNNFKSITINQFDFLTDKEGQLNIDFIGKMENLQEDYDKIKKILNLPTTLLPHKNKGIQNTDYRKYYTESDTQKVYDMYKKDIEYFKYQF